jgi:hypothetical protein
MKVFMGFLLFCFFCGWLMHKQSMKRMTLFLVVFSAMVAFGYFFLNMI